MVVTGGDAFGKPLIAYGHTPQGLNDKQGICLCVKFLSLYLAEKYCLKNG